MECPLCTTKHFSLHTLESHLLTHGDDQSYTCTFCAQEFNRRDVLKRHWGTCKSRLNKGLPIPFYPRRACGRKKRACDRCSRLKRACDWRFPCNTCLANHHDCSYDGVQNLSKSAVATSENAEIPVCEDGKAGSFADDNDQPLFPDFSTSTPPNPTANSILQLDILRSLPSFYELEPNWWPSDVSLSPLNNFWPEKSDEREKITVRFDFLARFTSEKGLANSFRCGSLFQRQQIAALGGSDWDISPKEASESSFATIFPESLSSLNVSLPEVRPWELNPKSQRENAESEMSRLQSWAHHPLAFKTQEIIDRLKDTIRHKLRKSPITLEWSSLVENMCLHFFSPPNICKFLRIFWASWYPNCPIIHRPSFDPLTAPPSLLSSMVMIGSCLSPEKNDNQFAMAWFDAVEEMVFDDDWLEEDFTKLDWNRNREGNLKRLRLLQAAYFVCLFQHWEGSERSKQRIRRHRYNTLIAVSATINNSLAYRERNNSVAMSLPECKETQVVNYLQIARDMQPSSITHGNLARVTEDQKFDWESFIKTEEEIRFVMTSPARRIITYWLHRTLSYIFLLDGGFVIFNNMPPRMVVSELEMGLTCPDECFQALNTSDCLESLRKWAAKVPTFHRFSITSVLETMFQRELSIEKKELYAHFGVLSLFIIITALHTLVFQLQNAMAPPEAFQRIENALENWKDIWVCRKVVCSYSDDTEDTESIPQMWKRVGFMKDACEFWLLCCVILERIRPRDDGNCIPVVPGRALRQLDQTNMKQVNDLMKNFETVLLVE